ncbi:hypothetical protein Tco_0186847, partial [Tanacetum coccineum]
NTISNSTEGAASPGRFPYEPDELIGGDSILSIQRRLLASYPFPSAEEIDFARIQAKDLFDVKDLEQNGKTSRAFFSLSTKVALRRENIDAESSA